MIAQQTIKQLVQTTGVGLHSGKRVTLTLRPAAPNTGIVFHRVDLRPVVSIPGQADYVQDTRMATVLVKDGARVSTVEHLLSALAGMGIDNVHVDIDNEEIPILDGSASIFLLLLQSAGVEKQKAFKQFIKVLEPVRIEEGDKWVQLEPYDGFSLSFSIDFQHPAIRSTASHTHIDFSTDSYAKEIARARTFGFVQDVEMLRAMGLARGGNYDNVIVMDEYRVLNADGLRYDDEFVKHKVLDAIGDLYLAGHPLMAKYTAYKSGHGMNNKLLRALFAKQGAWEKVVFDKKTAENKAWQADWALV